MRVSRVWYLTTSIDWRVGRKKYSGESEIAASWSPIDMRNAVLTILSYIPSQEKLENSANKNHETPDLRPEGIIFGNSSTFEISHCDI